jgi:hypothetical protein
MVELGRTIDHRRLEDTYQGWALLAQAVLDRAERDLRFEASDTAKARARMFFESRDFLPWAEIAGIDSRHAEQFRQEVLALKPFSMEKPVVLPYDKAQYTVTIDEVPYRVGVLIPVESWQDWYEETITVEDSEANLIDHLSEEIKQRITEGVHEEIRNDTTAG